MSRWSPEQVAAAAPSAAALAAARPVATAALWAHLGADARVVWGTYRGTAAEPYEVVVDHVGVGSRCTCPSRRTPCKHVLALLLLWIDGAIVDTIAPPAVEAWLSRQRPRPDAPAAAAAADGADSEDTEPGATASEPAPTTGPGGEPTVEPTPRPEPSPAPPDTRPEPSDRGRDERVARMAAGLDDLDRWIEDRLRTGLADPSLAQYGTWDQLAARLVDARAGSLANRIRRLAGLVGASPGWHGDVLAELGLLHLLAQAGRRLDALPGSLADAVATAVGWQVRQADVLGGVPDTDEWVVAGRSDTREDRIEVRRHWLYGTGSARWALVLSFAAYRQSLDASLVVGTAFAADLHRYPGPALRALVGERHGDWCVGARPPAGGVDEACATVGSMLAAEPWLDRVPFTVRAGVRPAADGWVLGDDRGSLPLLGSGGGRVDRPLATLLAVSGGEAVDVTCEWTPHGVVPLAVHLDERSIDIGPRADTSFVAA